MQHSGLAALLAIAALAAPAQNANSPEFFEAKVRPVLAANCYGCHTSSAMGGLRVDSAEGLSKGGKRGPAIVAVNISRS